MALETVTKPAIEPLTIRQVEDHLRVDDCSREYLAALIQVAREHAEMFTSRQFIEATYRLHLDEFPGAVDAIELPRPPLIAVESIKYVDTDGVEQTLDASKYKVDAVSEPGRVVPAYGESWPVARSQINAVTVEYKAGYGATRADVPQRAKQAMLLMCGDWYEHRENVVTGTIQTELSNTAKALLWGLRVMEAV